MSCRITSSEAIVCYFEIYIQLSLYGFFSTPLHGRRDALYGYPPPTLQSPMHPHTSDILVLKLISVLVFKLFSSQNFYFI